MNTQFFTKTFKYSLILFLNLIFFNQAFAQCSEEFNPVCAQNGTTYWNSCYASAAGQSVYTQGFCSTDNDGCIDPSQMVSPYIGIGQYDPVCGCNGFTYGNPGLAQAAGVTSFYSGVCSGSVNYTFTATLNAYNLGPGGAVITDSSCDNTNEPVCGCGQTYFNACYAELQGCSFYVAGDCDDGCLDGIIITSVGDQIYETLDTGCSGNYNPVCGCNGETYVNSCIAAAHGVTDWSTGACGGGSAWCNASLPLSCGDIILGELSAEDGNDLINYACSAGSFTMAGVDDVYAITKTQAGDLQVGLEIYSDADLDIFLLDENCSLITCLGSSTTNNASTNNEGFVYEDAPLGTYYVVVDAEFANVFSQYRLEVDCGYLSCDNVVVMEGCLPFHSGTNEFGTDAVNAYFCPTTNTLNVDNNGNEIVHSFIVYDVGNATENVTISLTNLSADLELFLLDACDRSRCLAFSQEGGTTNEIITANLAPGEYYIVVDGYNGAVGTYDLSVQFETDCVVINIIICTDPISLNVNVGNGLCSEVAGAVNASSSDGTPPYTVILTGPDNINEETKFFQNDISFVNLASGNYTMLVADSDGCNAMNNFAVENSPGLSSTSFTPTSQPESCEATNGSITVPNIGGISPYTLRLNGGIVNDNITSLPYTHSGLAEGDYSVEIADNNECSLTSSVTVEATGNALDAAVNSTPTSCGMANGSITVNITGGLPNYTIFINNVTEVSNTSDTNVTINNLSAGTYNILVEDEGGCSIMANTINIAASQSPPAVVFSQNITDLTVNFTNTSTNGNSYLWNFGDSNTSTEFMPTHTYSVPADYNVCLTVTNTCSSETVCNTVSLNVMNTDDVIVDVGDEAGAAGSTICVPVYITGLDNLGSLQGDISIADPSVAEVVGIQDGVLTGVVLGANSDIFSYFSSTGNGVEITDTDILFCIEVLLVGNPDDMTTMSFSDVTIGTVLENGTAVLVTGHTELDGTITILSAGQFNGLITTPWGNPVGQAIVNLTGTNGAATSYTTTADGNYNFALLDLGFDYTLTPSKNINPTNGVSSTFSLLVMQQFILGFNPPQIIYPEQVIAADVDCNDDANSFDLLLIQQMIVQNTNTFDQCPSWVFVDGNHVFTTPFDDDSVFNPPFPQTASVSNLTGSLMIPFTGVKKGDILGLADPNMLMGGADERNGDLILKIEDKSLQAGEIVQIPVLIEGFTDMVSLQAGLNFDQEKMEFLELITPLESAVSVVSGITIDDPSELRVSWFSPAGTGHNISANKELFYLQFQAIEDIESLSNVISLVADTRFSGRAFDTYYSPYSILLEITGDNGTTPIANQFGQYVLGQNTPNPFSEKTSINFEIPSSNQVTLSFFDCLGREIIREEGFYEAGEHSIIIKESELGKGLFYYTMQSGDFTATKQMVVL